MTKIEQNWSQIKWPRSVTEIHVHLGGSVPLYRLWELALRRGIRGMGDGYEEFVNIVKRQEGKVFDLDSYLEIYDRIELIQSGPEALRESLLIAVHRAYLSGGMLGSGPGGEYDEGKPLFSIGRLELRLNPLKRTGAVFLKGEHAGLYDVDRVIKAACDAVEEIEIGFKNKIQVGLLFCYGRDMTHEANMILARKVSEWKLKRKEIIGLDLAGPESVNPLSDPQKLKEMKEAFDAAGSGLGRTVHVGETPHVDLSAFINTIEALSPSRVAHPIVAFRALWDKQDDRGIKLMQERDIICELCVKSNLLTGAVKSIQEYKRVVDTLDEYGIKYTFSTDAPSLQVTSLADELFLLYRDAGVTEDQIQRALRTADENTFLPPRQERA